MKILRLIGLLSFVGLVTGFAKDFKQSAFQPSSGDELRYALLKPGQVKGGEKYPLVITLHGVGGRGKTNWERNCYANTVLAKPEMRERFPCFVMAPTTESGETWWSSAGLQGKERLPDVFELIEHLLDELPIDRNRVYVTGQSMGGFGTFGAMGQRPNLFAAGVPVCGGYDPGKAKAFSNLPVWIFHGSKDPTIPVKRSREMVEALKKAGGKPEYTEFPNAGHNAWTPAYDNEALWSWLFNQRRG